jgi:hypothetical protein
MRCLDCRATIEEGSNFCRHCGASQYVEPPVPQVAPRSPMSPVSPVIRPGFRWRNAIWPAVLIGFVGLYFAARIWPMLSPDDRAGGARREAVVSAESARASAEASRAIAEARAMTDAMEAELTQAHAAATDAVDRADGMEAERDMRSVQ